MSHFVFVNNFYLFYSGFLSSNKMPHTYYYVILRVRHSEAIMFICSFADIPFGHLVKVSVTSPLFDCDFSLCLVGFSSSIFVSL